MDAKQLGTFIAERRRELGMTQAHLAEKLHVTDKAVSRWERGVGLPDINSVETLAEALDVSLIEVMQAKRNENENITKKEAEQLVADTIQLSKTANGFTKGLGSIILGGFAMISLFLLWLLISDGYAALFSVCSIITGLVAWGIPIWHITFSRTGKIASSVGLSLGAAVISLVSQFYDIAGEVHEGDWSALMDTIDALIVVVVLFCGVTFALNVIMAILARKK